MEQSVFFSDESILGFWQDFNRLTRRIAYKSAQGEDWVLDRDLVAKIMDNIGENGDLARSDGDIDEDRKIKVIKSLNFIVNLLDDEQGNINRIKSIFARNDSETLAKREEFLEALTSVLSAVSFYRAFVVFNLLAFIIPNLSGRMKQFLSDKGGIDPLYSVMRQRIHLFEKLIVFSNLTKKSVFDKAISALVRTNKRYYSGSGKAA